MIVEILSGVVLVDCLHVRCLLGGEVLNTGVSLEVVLNVVDLSLGIDPLVGVGAVAIHVSVSIRSTSAGEEDGHLMKRLRAVAPKVESSVRILDTSSRVTLLAVNEVRELDGVTNEENGGVVSDHVVVSLFGVELNCEAARISLGISCTQLSCNSRESEEQRSALTNLIEELSLSESKFKVDKDSKKYG